MKILVIDEDLEVEVLVRVLRNQHPTDEFALAESLAQGLELARSRKWDVIVVDLMMPADEKAVPGSSEQAGLIAGIRLIEHIQKEKDNANNTTPLVILTALPEEGHPEVKRAKEKYKERFVQKPVHPVRLYEVLTNASQNI
jgi:CheY-like chemotaxis protein